jgi:hypothetical protein
MSMFWIATCFREPETIQEYNLQYLVSAEPEDSLFKVVKSIGLPSWVDPDELAFWKVSLRFIMSLRCLITHLRQMMPPVRRQAYTNIECSSPATDATLSSLDKGLPIAILKLAEADTVGIFVTNFSYHPISFTLTTTSFLGHVRRHIKPESPILRIIEDIRKQCELRPTDKIIIYTVCRFLESLPHQPLTIQPTDSTSSLPR